jgi:hypothetical protein
MPVSWLSKLHINQEAVVVGRVKVRCPPDTAESDSQGLALDQRQPRIVLDIARSQHTECD